MEQQGLKKCSRVPDAGIWTRGRHHTRGVTLIETLITVFLLCLLAFIALPTWLISDYLLRGELLPLFCENGLPAAETSGIYALRLAHETNSRSRLLLEFLKSRFSPIPPWDLALRSELRWQ